MSTMFHHCGIDSLDLPHVQTDIGCPGEHIEKNVIHKLKQLNIPESYWREYVREFLDFDYRHEMLVDLVVNQTNNTSEDRLETVLQKLTCLNISENRWSEYIQEWIDVVCIKEESEGFMQEITKGKVVKKMLQQYWRLKNQERYKDILEKSDVLILCGILEICCRFSVNQTQLINQVLLCTHESNPLVFNSYFDMCSPNFCSTEYNVVKKERLNYFLWHTNQARTLFSGQRLTERILYSANEKEQDLFLVENKRIKTDSTILNTILSYGTFDLIATGSDYATKKLYTFPVFNMLRDILADMYFCFYSNNASRLSFSLWAGQPEFKDHLVSLQLLLRSIARIPKEFIDNTNFWPDSRWGKFNFSVILHHFLLWDQLPDLHYRIGHPAKLQHLCRISIRKSLYQNWELPNGIQKLSLPDSLCRYIELKSD